jgi:hypothetical protein
MNAETKLAALEKENAGLRLELIQALDDLANRGSFVGTTAWAFPTQTSYYDQAEQAIQQITTIPIASHVGRIGRMIQSPGPTFDP